MFDSGLVFRPRSANLRGGGGVMELRGGGEKQCVQVPFEKVEPALRRPTPRWLNVGGVEPSNQSEIGKAAKRR